MSDRPLGIYPDWAHTPELIAELIAQIAYKCNHGTPLNEEENRYIAEAFGKILNGDPANRALCLVNKAAPPFTIHWDIRATIYNAVENLKEDPRFLHKSSGEPNKSKIFKELAGRTDIRDLLKLKDNEILKPDRIKKIYYDMVGSIERTKGSAIDVR